MLVLNINSRRAKTWQEAVREKMRELRITQVAMADRLGVTQGGIGHWLNDTRKPNLDQINMMLRECHLTEFYVYPVAEKDIDPANRVPLISWSSIPHAGCDIAKSSHLDHLIAPCASSARSFCLSIPGDVYLPDYRDGEIVLVDMHEKPRNGDFVLAEGHGICKLVDGHEGRFLMIESERVEFDGQIIGVIVSSWTIRR